MPYELYILPLLFLLYLMHLKFSTSKRGYGRYRKLFVWLHNRLMFIQKPLCPANAFLDRDLRVQLEVVLLLQLSVVKQLLHPAAHYCSLCSSRGCIPFGTRGRSACVVAHLPSFVKII